MNKVAFGVIIVLVMVFAIYLVTPRKRAVPVFNNATTVTNINTVAPANNNTSPSIANTVSAAPSVTPLVVIPITDFFSRITKKPFGIFITPKTSPVQPEKFTGYHTGVDAETTVAEATTDVPVFAIAAGTVIFAGHVNGYGGVIMIRHTLDHESITALYGHLRISSFTVKVGDTIKVNEKIAVLGAGYSSETDGERKHLHLGIIKGTTITYRGYVTSKSALSAWEDPVAWLKANGA